MFPLPFLPLPPPPPSDERKKKPSAREKKRNNKKKERGEKKSNKSILISLLKIWYESVKLKKVANFCKNTNLVNFYANWTNKK